MNGGVRRSRARGPRKSSSAARKRWSAEWTARCARFARSAASPLVIDHAAGTRLYDVDGREYLDYVCSWGALILGHAHPDVVAAVADQAERGTSYGMTSPLEIELGEKISRAIPSVEMVRFVSSGTEAAMSAVRLARAFTERDLVIKFEGCYHGHSDGFLSEAGSGLATLGIAACPGVPDAFAKLTLNAPYNDLAGVENLFRQHLRKLRRSLSNQSRRTWEWLRQRPDFLEGLREITKREGALLIFDEVITGFRMAYGGAQQVYKIDPDLTVMGKIIGGGLPVAAYGGKRHIMERVAPLGPVYQAGTLSGNPLAMRAGLATLPKLEGPGFYEAVNARTAALGRRFASGAKGIRHRGRSECRGFTADDFLLRRPDPQLLRREEIGHRTVREILPGNARARNFPASFAIRSAFRFRRTHRLQKSTERSTPHTKACQVRSQAPEISMSICTDSNGFSTATILSRMAGHNPRPSVSDRLKSAPQSESPANSRHSLR